MKERRIAPTSTVFRNGVIVESGPVPAAHGVVRWRLIDLAQWVWNAFLIRISKQTLSRELRAMG